MKQKQPHELDTTAAVAAALEISEQAVRRLAARKLIPSIKLGYKTLRFRMKDVLAAIERLERKAIR